MLCFISHIIKNTSFLTTFKQFYFLIYNLYIKISNLFKNLKNTKMKKNHVSIIALTVLLLQSRIIKKTLYF